MRTRGSILGRSQPSAAEMSLFIGQECGEGFYLRPRSYGTPVSQSKVTYVSGFQDQQSCGVRIYQAGADMELCPCPRRRLHSHRNCVRRGQTVALGGPSRKHRRSIWRATEHRRPVVSRCAARPQMRHTAVPTRDFLSRPFVKEL